MSEFFKRLGLVPFSLIGLGFAILGIITLDYLTNSIWPIDVNRLDLVRAVAQDQANPAALLDAAYPEVLVAFLMAIALTMVGVTMPIAYILNKRFARGYPGFFPVMRQAIWAGLWIAFCIWLQMNRTFGIAVAALVAAVFVLLEIMLQIRNRAVEEPFN